MLLRTRFWTSELADHFRCELRQRRRSLFITMSADYCRSAIQVRPLYQLIARNAFLDSLNDADMRIRIFKKRVGTIGEAYTIATRREAFVVSATAGGGPTRSDNSRRSAHAVGNNRERPVIGAL